MADQYRAVVMERDLHRCQWCGIVLSRGEWNSCHHRKLRSQGGPDTPENRVMLCGSGTTGCHFRAHVKERPKAVVLGYIVPRGDDPAKVRMWSEPLGLWVHLRADGGWELAA
jgi:hypothetical protein